MNEVRRMILILCFKAFCDVFFFKVDLFSLIRNKAFQELQKEAFSEHFFDHCRLMFESSVCSIPKRNLQSIAETMKRHTIQMAVPR